MLISGLLLNLLVGLGSKLLTERFISRAIVIALREIASRTHNTWDDDLVASIRDEVAPDMQMEQPKDWVVHESTELLTIPSNPENLTERKAAM